MHLKMAAQAHSIDGVLVGTPGTHRRVTLGFSKAAADKLGVSAHAPIIDRSTALDGLVINALCAPC